MEPSKRTSRCDEVCQAELSPPTKLSTSWCLFADYTQTSQVSLEWEPLAVRTRDLSIQCLTQARRPKITAKSTSALRLLNRKRARIISTGRRRSVRMVMSWSLYTRAGKRCAARSSGGLVPVAVAETNDATTRAGPPYTAQCLALLSASKRQQTKKVERLSLQDNPGTVGRPMVNLGRARAAEDIVRQACCASRLAGIWVSVSLLSFAPSFERSSLPP